MKTHERLKKIRESKFTHDQLFLARDTAPGTDLDMKLLCVCSSWQYRKLGKPVLRDFITDLGEELATAIVEGNDKLFTKYAKAIRIFKKHKPCPDKFRAAMIEITIQRSRIFKRQWLRDELKKRGQWKDTEANEKQLTRVIHELGLKTEGKPGMDKFKG